MSQGHTVLVLVLVIVIVVSQGDQLFRSTASPRTVEMSDRAIGKEWTARIMASRCRRDLNECLEMVNDSEKR